MKRIVKIILCAFMLLVGSLLFGKEVIYAADEEFEIELSEQEIQELLDTLNENKGAETITKHIVRRIENTPENMARLIIDSNSEYDVRAYSYSYIAYAKVLGVRVDIAKISMSGEVYFYKTTNQVYLRSMEVDVTIYNGGWDFDVTEPSIYNDDDGMLAQGRAYVELTKSGESHLFGCSVTVGNGSASIYTNITQID